MNIDNMAGFRIIEDDRLVVKGMPKIVQRTWRERLLTWPFRPFVKTRAIPQFVPSTRVIEYKGNLVMHPVMKAALMRNFESPR